MFFGNPTQRPQRSLQTSGQGHEALAAVDDRDVAPTGIGKSKLVQAVSKRHASNLHVEFVCHGEVRYALASRRVFLRKVDLPFGSKLGTPQMDTALQGAQHACIPLAGIAALEFFEQGDGVEPGIGLQQRNDFAIPDRTERVFSGSPVPCWSL